MIPIVNNNSATVKYTIVIVGICALIITGSVMSSVYMSILESNYDEGNEITKYDCGNENYTVRRWRFLWSLGPLQFLQVEPCSERKTCHDEILWWCQTKTRYCHQC